MYIGLDEESRTKGKAAIDVVGAQSGKSLGSVLQQALLLATGGALAGALLHASCQLLEGRLECRRQNIPTHCADASTIPRGSLHQCCVLSSSLARTCGIVVRHCACSCMCPSNGCSQCCWPTSCRRACSASRNVAHYGRCVLADAAQLAWSCGQPGGLSGALGKLHMQQVFSALPRCNSKSTTDGWSRFASLLYLFFSTDGLAVALARALCLSESPACPCCACNPQGM